MYKIDEKKVKLPVVRIQKITLDHFKGVDHGVLEMNCLKEDDPFGQSDILGLYGQNGSGKSAIVDALNIVKSAISGYRFGSDFIRMIAVRPQTADTAEKPWAKITVEFAFRYPAGTFGSSDPGTDAIVEYSMKLTDEERTTPGADDYPGQSYLEHYMGISEEIIRTNLYADGSLGRIHAIVDTTNEKHMFCSAALEKYFFCDYNACLGELLYQSRKAREDSHSFIFSEPVASLLRFSAPEADTASSDALYYNILCELRLYAASYLYVIGTTVTGVIQVGAGIPINLPGFYRPIFISDTKFFPARLVSYIEPQISRINLVLKELVPGLQLKLETTEALPDEKGEPQVKLRVFSVRGDRVFPFNYESDGIIRIVAMLADYIFAYNNPSATLVIDEFDAGIHEYLYGQLLQLFAQNAQGQLIFTSHNLRPLEMIDKKFIRYTTSIADDRYCKPQKVGVTNNLRDLYLRSVSVAGLKTKKKAINDPKLYTQYAGIDQIDSVIHSAGKIRFADNEK